MAYNDPGVDVTQKRVLQEDITPEEAELPGLLVGPLYEVLEQKKSGSTLDPTQGKQTFSWPGKRTGTKIDLEAVVSGRIDDQMKKIAAFGPDFYLEDDRGVHGPIDGKHIESIDQSDFDILESAKSGFSRASLDVVPIRVDNTVFFRKDPTEGALTSAEIGDKFTTSFGGTSQDFKIKNISARNLYVETPGNIDLSSVTQDLVGEEYNSNPPVDAKQTTTPGEIELVAQGGNAKNAFDSFSKNDILITGHSLTGFKNAEGQYNLSNSNPGGNPPTLEIDGLTGNSGFGRNISTSEVKNAIVKLHLAPNGADKIGFYRLVSIDTSSGTITVTEMQGGVGGDAAGDFDNAAADNDRVDVTIYHSEVGYIKGIKDTNKKNDTAAVVISNVDIETDTFAHIFSTSKSFKTFPVFDVLVSYRQLRKDLAGSTIEVGRESDFLDEVGHDIFHPHDGAGMAFRTLIRAQPSNRNVFFEPVDTDSNGIDTGYSNAIDNTKTVNAHTFATYHLTSGIRSKIKSHVNTLNSQGTRRRAILWREVPIGDTNSESGQIAPGRTPDGEASSSSEGNTYIYDHNVDFVNGAGVGAGTSVKVSWPDKFAGEYVATGGTTDDVLVLERGADGDWPIEREFQPSNDPDMSSDTMEVVASSGKEYGLEVNTSDLAGGASDLREDFFAQVQPGDFVEATYNGVTYRLRVKSVDNGPANNNTALTVIEEVAGSASFSTSDVLSGVSVIRSWGWDSTDSTGEDVPPYPPAVAYHIDVLSPQDQVNRLKTTKTTNDRRFSVALDYQPIVPVDGVDYQMATAVSLCGYIAKRSGLPSSQELTNLNLGGGITDVKWGNYFSDSQLDELADAGFLLLEQKSKTAEPYIRDSITASTSGNLADQEEVAVSSVDWQERTLEQTFGPPQGQQLPSLTKRLLGVRAAQLDSILKQWRDEEDRIRSFEILKVEKDPNNARRTSIAFREVVMLAEKEIGIEIRETV